ncbi:ElaA protein [Granulicatella balaenopterae]|uniref:ElaA protein n=1 Tax=Granulicatella balaenopterae TaxID=137733 RepID=A0A1H9P063_9LACT|nr:GNAT family N-acetyltransferase [Granulicatella balaenopterae]SER41674.1 ElaA protein [Granulicatella balaenopterae]
MWKCKSLAELTSVELYRIYKARVNVFVVEQTCPYPEVDESDLDCLHIFQEQDGRVIAYARLIRTKKRFKIGRVLVNEAYRGHGLARELVQFVLDKASEIDASLPVYAQAQAYLVEFYQSFGFDITSEVYLEDEIPHVDMELIRK